MERRTIPGINSLDFTVLRKVGKREGATEAAIWDGQGEETRLPGAGPRYKALVLLKGD